MDRINASRRAFTLIEMLTVIAIIGILAAILIPTVQMAIKNARRNVAKADIANLATAVNNYQMEFGAPPPDNSAGIDDDEDGLNLSTWQEDLSPNECLVWFLTRDFGPGFTAGIPSTPTERKDWIPSSSREVYARISFNGGFDMKQKQTRDLDKNGFEEFIDPWGRPYMYKAYTFPESDIASVAAPVMVGSGPKHTVTITLEDPINFLQLQELTTTPETERFLKSNNLLGTRGRIQLSGFTTNNIYNGTFAFEGKQDATGKGVVEITFNNNPGAAGTVGKYRFALHNENGVDIYSLGPNGATRTLSRPTGEDNTPIEWQPVDEGTFRKWVEVWGTPGDGHDILNDGNIISDERSRDDISSWE